MYPFIVGILLLACFCGAFYAIKKFLGQKSASPALQADLLALDERISAADRAIQDCISYCSDMISLDIFREKEEQLSALTAELSTERAKLEKLDAQVASLQSNVETEESMHNDRKRGKEEAASLADEVRENTERLASELARLEQELNQSLSQLTALNSEVELTHEQKIALDSVHSGVVASREQLNNLAEVAQQAALRFTNLESQYQELEQEFTKLVEKELSGEF